MTRAPHRPGAWRSMLTSLRLMTIVTALTTTATNGAESILQGRFVFERNCMVCHGRRGDGKGELAPGLDPPPRDFRAGLFKFRSTPAGALPTDDDLKRTIRGGLGGTAMPIYAHLTERDLGAVIEYIKTLSPRWQDAKNHQPPLTLPETPDWVIDLASHPKRVAAGRARFLAFCAPCHGESGRGDGPAAATLRDHADRPAKPRDLRSAPLRGGDTARDLYRTLLTGLDGTPMPAFAEGMTEEQRWELAAYVRDLRQVARAEAEKLSRPGSGGATPTTSPVSRQ
jgi:mono/diheme cytochrome c family protein